jgi:hypothetical protein
MRWCKMRIRNALRRTEAFFKYVEGGSSLFSVGVSPAEQLWFLARGKLGFFDEGLYVNEELSHGSDDGAFVRFAPVAQPLDVGGNDRVAGGGCVGGHVEAFSDLGAAALDGPFAGELSAVAVKGGNAGQGDEAVAGKFLHLAQVGEEGPRGDP